MMHAQIMQDEAATTHTAPLLGRHCHCTQSIASTSAGSPAATTALKPFFPKPWCSTAQTPFPARYGPLQHPELNSNTERYQIYVHQGYSSDTTLRTPVSVL